MLPGVPPFFQPPPTGRACVFGSSTDEKGGLGSRSTFQFRVVVVRFQRRTRSRLGSAGATAREAARMLSSSVAVLVLLLPFSSKAEVVRDGLLLEYEFSKDECESETFPDKTGGVLGPMTRRINDTVEHTKCGEVGGVQDVDLFAEK
jgi:hypothetical protein